MLLVPDAIYRAHIRRAQQSFWQGILPQFDSLPGRLTLCAKRAGPREWSVWSISPGRTWFAPYIGALHGWLWPQLPAVSLDLSAERRVDWHFSYCRALTLRQAFIVTHTQQVPYCRPNLGDDLFCVASAVGPELRRIFYVCLDELDGLGRGIDPNSIKAGRPVRTMTPKPDSLIEYFPGQPPARLSAVAELERGKMRAEIERSKQWEQMRT